MSEQWYNRDECERLACDCVSMARLGEFLYQHLNLAFAKGGQVLGNADIIERATMTTKTENGKTVFADLIAAELEWDFVRDRWQYSEHPNTMSPDWLLESPSVTIDVSDFEFIPLEVHSRDAKKENSAPAPWTAKLITVEEAVVDNSSPDAIYAEYVTQQDFSA